MKKIFSLRAFRRVLCGRVRWQAGWAAALVLLLHSAGALAQTYAYVANNLSNNLSVINAATNTVVATVSLDNGPQGVALTPDGGFAYVTNRYSASVSVINTASNTVAATVAVGNEPFDIALTPDGGFAYVTNFSSNTVSVINTAGNTVVATIPVGNIPQGIAITPDGSFAYVANSISANVSVISTASNTVVTTVAVEFGPLGVAITPNGSFAYVVNSGSDDVSVINTATNTVVTTVAVGDTPYGVAITPNGSFAYVANSNSDNVSVINTASNTVAATVTVSDNPFGVAITPDGNFVYVTNIVSGNVSVISTSSNTVVTTVPVESFPVGVACAMTTPEPSEMEVQGNSVSVADGDNTPDAADDTDFGNADIFSGAVSRTFTIANTGALYLKLTGSPKVQISGANASDFTVTAQPDAPVRNGGATTFTIAFDPSDMGLRTATVSIANDDGDENPYNFAIQGTGVGAQEMDVRGNSVSIADGDNTPDAADDTDFGATNIFTGSVDRVFTIANLGNGDLNLTGAPKVQITGANAADFSVILQPSSPVTPNNSTSFTVHFDPRALGLRSATISIANDDADENPYDFAIQGTGTVLPFAFLANKVTLKSTKQVPSYGDIHSNGLLTIEKGYPSTYNSNLTAIGKITINKQNTINGNVKSQTSVSNSGKINGTKTIGAVANEPLPSLSYSAGGSNVTVPNGGSLTLAPGSYGIVTMNQGGTLKLSSGEYFMSELRYSDTIEAGTIEIDLSSGEPITINVVTNLQFGHEAAIVLLPNGESDSELVTFNTMQSTNANWGREGYFVGSFNAPNAIVTLVKNSQLRGSICAKEILVSNDCLFLHHDSPGSLPGPGNLPKTSFDDDDEQPATSNEQPVSYQLEQNYPNPFNPSTTISFALPQASEVSLSIFNMSGQLVKRLVSGEMNAGSHSFTWDATNEHGERVASGVYLYVIKAGEFTAQRKLVLMK